MRCLYYAGTIQYISADDLDWMRAHCANIPSFYSQPQASRYKNGKVLHAMKWVDVKGSAKKKIALGLFVYAHDDRPRLRGVQVVQGTG